MWVHSSVLVDEPGFRRIRSSAFPNLGMGLAHFWPNRFEVQDFWSLGFKWVRILFLVDEPGLE